MKKVIPFLIFAAVFLFSVFAFSGKSFSQGIPFTILHFNDSHSHLNGTGPKNSGLEYLHGGFDRIAKIIKSTRAADSNVMVFHIGDFFTGSFFFNRYFGVPELMLFKRFNFDAVTLGNHEFDLGPALLYSSLSQSFLPGSIPMLSANLNMSAFPVLSSYVTPYNIKTIRGIKFGFFGLTYPDPSSNPFPIIISDSILQTAQNTVSVLQSNGCNVIICLSHVGYLCDSEIASMISGVHIILGAHDHSAFAQPVPVPNPAGFNTLVCQAGGHYEYAGKLRFFYNNGNVVFNDYQLINVDTSIVRDDSVRVFLDSLKPGIISKFGNVFTNVVSSAVTDIAPSYNPLSPNRDTPLGNLITDAHRNEGKTQIALSALGMMSEAIYKGPVVGEDFFRVVPYGYDTTNSLDLRLIKFSISGSELIRGLENVLWLSTVDISYLPQSSGLTYDYNSHSPFGHKIILSTLKVNDTLLNNTYNYSVTVNEGLFKALTKLGIQVTNVVPMGINEYTSLIDFAYNSRRLNYTSQGRMRDISITSVKHINPVTTGFELFGNYPNPFNPSTTLRFCIEKEGKVKIDLFDMSGRLVSVLSDKNYTQGYHTVKINSGSIGLSSGVYFCRMEYKNQYKTIKMVLLK